MVTGPAPVPARPECGRVILHVATRTAWDAAVAAGTAYAPEAYPAEGFIHLCTGRQLRGVLRRFFTGAGGLVLLGVDEERLGGVPLLWEAAGVDRFPHAGGPIPPDAVVEVAPLPDRPEAAVSLGPQAASLCARARGDEPPGVVSWPIGGGRNVTTDPVAVPRDALYALLLQTYWSTGLTREVLDRALDGSLCFTVSDAGSPLIAFCRLVTDGAVHAHLVDVVVAPPWRGAGVGTAMVECVLDHPWLQGLRRWTLDTRDAQDFYARRGFVLDPVPGRHMVRRSDPVAGPLPPRPFARG